jgi:hypothetical protein
LDAVPVAEKKRTLRRTRRFKLKRSVAAFSRQYPQDDLIQALDKKLAALQSPQALERNLRPRYIWGSDSDASPETMRGPDVLTGFKRRVVSDSQSMGKRVY